MASSPRTSDNITADALHADSAAGHQHNLFSIPPFKCAAPHAARMEDEAIERGYEHAQAPHWTINHFSAGYFTTELVFTGVLSEEAALTELTNLMNISAIDNKSSFYIKPETGVGVSHKNHALIFLVMLLQPLFSARRATGRGGAR